MLQLSADLDSTRGCLFYTVHLQKLLTLFLLYQKNHPDWSLRRPPEDFWRHVETCHNTHVSEQTVKRMRYGHTIRLIAVSGVA